MPFVKVQKTKAYFKRFQVKYRRRREGKTDYAARRALVIQDKNKYDSHKYRLVVRITNHYVICQIVYSELKGDKVLASAYSSELKNYGVKVGLKNYAAAYLTGLLVARRVLTKLGLAEIYEGVEEPTGVVIKTARPEEMSKSRPFFYVSEVDGEKRPFRCYLDVGIRTTTTGSRVFGALKGAVDGGLDIPHNEKRFPGYIREAKKGDADALRERIMGEHVAGYMEYLESEDQEAYQKLFNGYLNLGLDADGVRAMYEEAVKGIKENPAPAAKKPFKFDTKFKKATKLSLEERKARIQQKKVNRARQLAAAMAGDDE